ncbi:unnamed protein product [Caenorhabditis brenneri]
MSDTLNKCSRRFVENPLKEGFQDQNQLKDNRDSKPTDAETGEQVSYTSIHARRLAARMVRQVEIEYEFNGQHCDEGIPRRTDEFQGTELNEQDQLAEASRVSENRVMEKKMKQKIAAQLEQIEKLREEKNCLSGSWIPNENFQLTNQQLHKIAHHRIKRVRESEREKCNLMNFEQEKAYLRNHINYIAGEKEGLKIRLAEANRRVLQNRKLKRQPLAPQSADANNHASMDSENGSDARMDMEDSEDNDFRSNLLP